MRLWLLLFLTAFVASVPLDDKRRHARESAPVDGKAASTDEEKSSEENEPSLNPDSRPASEATPNDEASQSPQASPDSEATQQPPSAIYDPVSSWNPANQQQWQPQQTQPQPTSNQWQPTQPEPVGQWQPTQPTTDQQPNGQWQPAPPQSTEQWQPTQPQPNTEQWQPTQTQPDGQWQQPSTSQPVQPWQPSEPQPNAGQEQPSPDQPTTDQQPLPTTQDGNWQPQPTQPVADQQSTQSSSSEVDRKATSEYIQRFLSPDLNPCDDFYRYSCGKTEDDDLMPDYAEELKKMMTQQLTKSTTAESSRALDLVKRVYTSCMNVEKRKQSQELLQAIERFGGWPLIEGDAWDKCKFDLTALLIETDRTRLINEGIADVQNSVLVKVRPSWHNVELFNQIEISLGDLPIAFKTIGDDTKKELMEKIQTLAFIVLEQKGEEPNDDEVNEAAEDVYYFLEAIIDIVEQAKAANDLPDDEKPDTDKNYSNLEQIAVVMPTVDFPRYFQAHLPAEWLAIVSNAEEKKFSVFQTRALQLLDQLVKDTDPRVVQNYFILRFLLRSHTEEEYRGTKPTRVDRCFTDLRNILRHASTAYFVKYFVPETLKPKVEAMVNNVIGGFREIVNQATWLDDYTRQGANQKLDNLTKIVAYPDCTKDEASIDRYYGSTYEKLRDDMPYLEMTRTIMIEGNLRYQTNPRQLGVLPGSVIEENANYQPQINTITIYAGYLRNPHFNETFTAPWKYGALYAFGHEIVHGFDSDGANYDSKGSARNWWSDETKQKFDEKGQCLVDQFNSIVEPKTGMHLDGKKTLGENIADLDGFKAHLRAYQNYASKAPPEKPLPGLEQFTSEQLFFIGFGQNSCGKPPTATELKIQIETDEHSVDSYRVTEVLKNTPEFARAFNCPVGSPMNPEKKCFVWAEN